MRDDPVGVARPIGSQHLEIDVVVRGDAGAVNGEQLRPVPAGTKSACPGGGWWGGGAGRSAKSWAVGWSRSGDSPGAVEADDHDWGSGGCVGGEKLRFTKTADLYELINERANRSLILPSNRSPVDWYTLFPNPVVAESLLDRLINNSRQILMNKASYRPHKRPGRVVPQDTAPPR